MIDYKRSSRVEKLNDEIDLEFASDDDGFVDPLTETGDYTEVITEMITVVKSNRGFCLARELYGERHFDFVYFPPLIQRLLKPDDTFLVTIGLRAGQWDVLFSSPRYESIEIEL